MAIIKKSLFVPLEPFSVNRMHSRDKRFKSAAYKDWEMQLITYLRSKANQESFAALRHGFDPKLHCFVVRITVHYSKLLNQQGEVSSKNEDLSNIEKPLLDVLFLPKYHSQPEPYGMPNINCDDKFVLQLTSRKRQSKSGHSYMLIQVARVNRPT